MSTRTLAAPAPAPPPPVPARPAAPLVAALAVLVAALFGNTFVRLAGLWERDASYSHGYVVAVVSLLLAYRIARRVGPPERGELLWGLSGVALGVFCQWAVTVLRWPPLSYVGLICVLRGLLVCAGGRAWAAAFNFPLLFLFFMFPLPVAWTSFAALWLQDAVSRVSETVLGLFVVCHRVGHNIRIAGVDQSLVVAEECSGLGQIVSFVAFALLLGHFLNRPMWSRVVLVVVAVPVAIAANTLRVVLMNLGAVYFGTKWMSGALHDAPALFSVPVGFVLFVLIDRVVQRLAADEAPGGEPAAPAPSDAPPAPRGLSAGSLRALGAGAAALVAGVAGQFALADHLRSAGEPSYPGLRSPLETLPLRVDDPKTGGPLWAGTELADARDAIRKKLPFAADDILVRGYRGARGTSAQLYMVHSRAGEDRKHHPEICIREVSGAPEDVRFRQQVALRPDGSAAAQRFRFQTGTARSVVVYYWHYTLRPADDPSRTRLQELHQRVGVAAPSVTAQVSVSGDDPQGVAAVEKQLLPALDAAARRLVLPPGTEAGCNRVPIALVRQ